jgi:hypothetical protein
MLAALFLAWVGLKQPLFDLAAVNRTTALLGTVSQTRGGHGSRTLPGQPRARGRHFPTKRGEGHRWRGRRPGASPRAPKGKAGVRSHLQGSADARAFYILVPPSKQQLPAGSLGPPALLMSSRAQRVPTPARPLLRSHNVDSGVAVAQVPIGTPWSSASLSSRSGDGRWPVGDGAARCRRRPHLPPSPAPSAIPNQPLVCSVTLQR